MAEKEKKQGVATAQSKLKPQPDLNTVAGP